MTDHGTDNLSPVETQELSIQRLGTFLQQHTLNVLQKPDTEEVAPKEPSQPPAPVASTEVAAAETGLVPLDSPSLVRGWQGIGRIDVGRGGTCSGALIEPDLVLTAAHCVIDDNNKRYPARALVFHAGYVKGDAVAVRRGKSVVYAPAYTAEHEHRATEIMHDVALIQLEEPISESIAQPFALHDDHLKDVDLTVVSYGRGRNEYPSKQSDCRLTDLHLGLYVFDCDLTFGSSGAPVFTLIDGTPNILTLVSAGTNVRNGDDETMVVGMVLKSHVARLKAALRSGQDLQATTDVERLSAIPRRIQMNARMDTSSLNQRFQRP